MRRQRTREDDSPPLWRRLAAFAVIVASGAGAAYLLRPSADAVVASSTPCRCVAFRLDDIVDAEPAHPQFRLMEFFAARGLPLTVGVIGARFGADPETVEFIRARLRASRGALEVANHGWNHEDFTALGRPEQRALIERTNERVKAILGVAPRLFIPPFNRMNADTRAALTGAGLTHVSSMFPIDRPPYRHGEEALVRVPALSATGDYVEGETAGWTRWPAERTLEFIESALNEVGFAVVMMHAREFTTDGDELDGAALESLDRIVGALREAGVSIRLLGDIASPVKPS